MSDDAASDSGSDSSYAAPLGAGIAVAPSIDSTSFGGPGLRAERLEDVTLEDQAVSHRSISAFLFASCTIIEQEKKNLEIDSVVAYLCVFIGSATDKVRSQLFVW